MKNINYIKKHLQAVFIILLLFMANLTFAQNNLVNSPYWKCISTSISGQSVAVIRADGTLWVWGHNASGQLGLGTTTATIPTPTKINDDTDWAYVSQGATFLLAIKTDGTLWAAGANNFGQYGSTATASTSIIQVGTATDWKYVTTTNNAAAGIKTDGTLWTWGQGTNGVLGNGATSNVTTAAQIGTDTWKAVNGGGTYMLAIRSDGTLWGWGANAAKQLGLGADAATSKSIPTQISTDTDWAQVAGSSDNMSMAIKTDGTIYSWGNNSLMAGTVPTQIPGTTNDYAKVTGGQTSFFALKTNGTLLVAGGNSYGQHGNGTATNITVSSFIEAGGAGSLWDDVAYRYRTVFAVKKDDGTLWAWGYNNRELLANGTTADSNVPVLIPPPLNPQFQEVTTATFTAVNWSSIDWADYDKDGFKDVLVTGSTTSGIAATTKLYKNNGDGTFTEVTHPFPNVTNTSAVAWADINNDGYPDVVLTGMTVSPASSNNVTKVYINNAGTSFTEVTTVIGNPINVPVFKAKYNSAVCWVDYDNDGYQDLIIAGSNKTSEGGATSTDLYKNNADGTFTYIPLPVGGTTTFQNVAQGCSIIATDYNGDGLTDIFIMGNQTGGGTARLYKNLGNGTFQEVTGHGITGTYSGSAQWVDYNNDGFPDISLVGQSTARLYKNNGAIIKADPDYTGPLFTEVNTANPFIGVTSYGQIKWFDYDGDGLSDVLITGSLTSVYTSSTTLYKNNGDDTFTKVPEEQLPFPKLMYGSIVLADFDNDGNPDVLLAGRDGTSSATLSEQDIHTKLYKNNWTGVANTNIPTGLTGTLASTTNIKFDWGNLAGATKYYLRIGTSSGAGDVVSGLNPVTTGTGNPLTGTFAINRTLTNGETYYWSVRTENASLNQSDWAPEQTFTVNFSTLPVTLVSFDVQKENNRVKLQWETSAENNNNRFVVERSTDGSTFILLQNVTPKGSAGGSYVVYDSNPQAGINYYRLTQVDNDGKTTQLGIKAVNYSLNADLALKTWPNPVVNNTLFVDFGANAGKALTVRLTDITGRTIHEQKLQQAQTKDIYTLTLSAKPQTGIYLLNVYGADVNYSNKIIVK